MLLARLPDKLPNSIIFDFDNTLVDTQESIHMAFNETLEAFGREKWSNYDLKNKVKYSPRDFLHQVVGIENELRAKDIFLAAYQRHSAKLLKPMKCAIELLAFFREKNIKQYVISNKRGHILRHEINNLLDWGGYFQKIVGSEDCPLDKPDPKVVEFTLGYRPTNEVWFIGDSDVDVACAKNSGCLAILISDDDDLKLEYEPDLHYPDLGALIAAMR